MVDSCELTGDDSHTFTLPKPAASYDVVEVAVEGYTTDKTVNDEKTAYSFTNTIGQSTFDITGTKAWTGVPEGENLPETVTVILNRNGEKIDEDVITAAEGWNYAFEGLDKYDLTTGKEYVYTVTDSVGGFTATDGVKSNGYQLTNAFVPDYWKTSFEVIKAWNDGGNADGDRPESIYVGLYAGDTFLKYAELTSDTWKHTFTDLPKYATDGKTPIQYTVKEGTVAGDVFTPAGASIELDGVTYTGIAVSYDTDVVDDLVDGSMYGGQSDCYVVRSNGDIVLELEPQTELCEGMTNLYDLSDHVDWKYGSMDDIRDCIQLGKSGSAQFTCDGVRNYLVAIPTAFSDWSLVGVIQTDEVDGAMLSVQQSTIIALGALCIFAVIIVVLALGMEEERLNLEREKMKSDRFLQSMSRIVDRYMVVNLDTGRYRYHELRSSEPLYPTSGQYSEMVEIISKRYVALTETENAKLSRLLTPDYLRSVLRKPDDNLKIEYCSRTENAYMVLTVLPVEWHADGTVAVVMQVVQDIGQKVELENMAEQR